MSDAETKGLVPILSDYNGPPIKGINPLTGLDCYFIPFDPSPGRAKIIFIIDDIWFYSTDAGKTWIQDPKTMDIREIDILIS